MRGHQWNKDAMVHIVIPVKNQGKWIVHVVKNLEDVSYVCRYVRTYACIVSKTSTSVCTYVRTYVH